MRSLLLGGSILWVGAALASEDDMSDIYADEHLQLLQVSARRHQQDEEQTPNPTYPGGLPPENSQGPYVTQAAGTECPDDQILTLRQCTEAAWSGAIANTNLQIQVYGAMNAPANVGQRGCFFLPANRGVYYNAGTTGIPDGRTQPVCGVNGGRLAQKQEEVTLPAAGVEHKPPNTLCDECGILNLDECRLAAESIGAIAPQNRAQGNGWPLFTTFNNPKQNRADQWLGPRGCFTVSNGREVISYWNMDTADDHFKTAPYANRRPVCKACPTTTTTTPPVTTPPPPPVEDISPGDTAASLGDPHITTNEGEHFDVAR